MANLVKSESYNTDKHILIANNSYLLTLSIQVANTGIDAGADGKKVIKAGTPVTGDITERDTAFTKDTSAPVGVILHDVDVTDGNNNATIVLAGCVDLLKLDTATQALITSGVKTALSNIFFVKGSEI